MHSWMEEANEAIFDSDDMAETVEIDAESYQAYIFHRDNDYDGLVTEFHILSSRLSSISTKKLIEYNNDTYEVINSHKDESGDILIVVAQNKKRY